MSVAQLQHCRQCLLHDCSTSRQGQSQFSRPVEFSSYGDGLLWGAGLLLHLLNQTAWFKLTDLSALIVQRQQLEYRIAGGALPAHYQAASTGCNTPLQAYTIALIIHINHLSGSTASVVAFRDSKCMMCARPCRTARKYLQLYHLGSKILGVQSQSFPEIRPWCRLKCSATGSCCVPHEGSSSQGQHQPYAVKPVGSPATAAAANLCADISPWATTAVRT